MTIIMHAFNSQHYGCIKSYEHSLIQGCIVFFHNNISIFSYPYLMYLKMIDQILHLV